MCGDAGEKRLTACIIIIMYHGKTKEIIAIIIYIIDIYLSVFICLASINTS